jgi:hypothetical protein
MVTFHPVIVRKVPTPLSEPLPHLSGPRPVSCSANSLPIEDDLMKIYNNDELVELIKNNNIISLYLTRDFHKIIDPIQCFELLKTNTSINYIYMSNNTNTNKYYKQLCKALQTNNYVDKLFITNKTMDHKISKWISKMLKVNTIINNLELIYLYIDNDAWSSLITTLSTNKTLRQIIISVHSINPRVIWKLASLLEVNSTLNTFKIFTANTFNPTQLIDALRNNSSITNFHLDGSYDRIPKYVIRNIHNIRLKTMQIQDL